MKGKNYMMVGCFKRLVGFWGLLFEFVVAKFGSSWDVWLGCVLFSRL